MTSLASRVVALCIALLLATSASGQDAPPDDHVRALLERGVEEYAAGRWDEARAIFEQAHRLRPTARTARGIGMAAFNQRDYVGAVTFLRDALASQEQPLTAAQHEQIEELLRQALGFVGRFRFTVSTPEARLEVRGAPTEPGAECVLPIGSHVVRAHAAGFLLVERTVEVRGGEEERVMLSLVPTPKASVGAAPQRDRLAVWGWSTLGGAGAIAGAALGVTLRSDAEFEALRRRCRDRRCFPEQIDTTKIERLDHAATALWIAGASVATTAAVLLTTAWLRSRRHDREKVELRASGRGLQLDVRF